MAVTINADTSNGLVLTPDTSGEINLQSNGVTKATIGSNGLYSTGHVLQVVQNTLTTTATSSSTSYVDTGLTASITPSSTSSKILISVSACLGKNDGGHGSFATITDGSGTNLILPSSAGSRTIGITRIEGFTGSQYTVFPINFNLLHEPSSTSSQTYKLQYKVNSASGIVSINRMTTDANAADYFSGISTITLMEIAG